MNVDVKGGLCDLIHAHDGHALALITEKQRLTYEDFRRLILQSSNCFTAMGVQPGDRVAMLTLNEPELLANLFALNQLGACLLPLNYRLSPGEWGACLDDSKARYAIVDDVWMQNLKDLQSRGLIPQLTVIALSDWRQAIERFVAPNEPNETHLSIASTNISLLVYTSGTQGKAKGVMHSTRGMIANAKASWIAHAMRSDDRVLSILPLFHVGGLCIQTLPALLLGACVVLHQRFEPAAWFDALLQHRPTLSLLVPAVMQALQSHPQWLKSDLSSLRLCMAGSSIVPVELIEKFHQRGISCGQVYGSTETGPVSIVLAQEQAVGNEGRAGWPALGVRVCLLDMAADGVGEIALQADNLAVGYWGRSSEDFYQDGWYRTGDLAFQGLDGAYTVVGRSKDMIISGGENIYPAELEMLVQQFDEVLECAAIGVPDERWGEVLALCVVLKLGKQLTLQQVQERLALRLARFKWPRQLHVLAQMPKTALGKIQKPLLQAQVLSVGHSQGN